MIFLLVVGGRIRNTTSETHPRKYASFGRECRRQAHWNTFQWCHWCDSALEVNCTHFTDFNSIYFSEFLFLDDPLLYRLLFHSFVTFGTFWSLGIWNFRCYCSIWYSRSLVKLHLSARFSQTFSWRIDFSKWISSFSVGSTHWSLSLSFSFTLPLWLFFLFTSRCWVLLFIDW